MNITIQPAAKYALINEIEYYRSQKKGIKYTRKNFVTQEIESICSTSYYSKLCTHKCIANDDIYFALLDKLNMYYTKIEALDALLQEIEVTVYKYFVMGAYPTLLHCLNRVIPVLSKHTNNIIYRATYDLILYIKQAILHQYDFNLIEKHTQLMSNFSIMYQSIIAQINYDYYTKIKINHEQSLQILENCIVHKPSTILLRYLHLLYWIRQNASVEANQACKQLIILATKQENTIYLAKAYNVFAYLSVYPKQKIAYLKQAIQCTPSIQDRNSFMMNIIITSFDTKNYPICLQYCNLIKHHQQCLLTVFPYYFASLSILQSSFDEGIALLQTLLSQTSNYYKRLAYFIIALLRKDDEVLFYLKQLIRKDSQSLMQNPKFIQALQLLIDNHTQDRQIAIVFHASFS